MTIFRTKPVRSAAWDATDLPDNLAVSAQGFRRGANRVRKQMWWKDMKMRVIIAIGVAVLIVIIVVPIVKAYVEHRVIFR